MASINSGVVHLLPPDRCRGGSTSARQDLLFPTRSEGGFPWETLTEVSIACNASHALTSHQEDLPFSRDPGATSLILGEVTTLLIEIIDFGGKHLPGERENINITWIVSGPRATTTLLATYRAQVSIEALSITGIDVLLHPHAHFLHIVTPRVIVIILKEIVGQNIRAKVKIFHLLLRRASPQLTHILVAWEEQGRNNTLMMFQRENKRTLMVPH